MLSDASRSCDIPRRSQLSDPGAPKLMVDRQAGHGAIDPIAKYAKRPRNKTKADKYEYKGGVDAKRPAQGSKRSKPRRLRGSNTLNEEFQATNIDVARVSLKPEKDLGLFSRSKKSVPLVGRDLPDLTFTKMDFLSKHAEAAQRDMAILRMQQNDSRHKRGLTDGYLRPQSGSDKPSSRGEYGFPAGPTSDHDHIDEGHASADPEGLQRVSGRDGAFESIL